MKPPLILTDRTGLLDLVHDSWFDLADVKFDQERKEVVFRLGPAKKGPYNYRLIKITDALRFEVRDEANIQIYDFCDLQVDASFSSIRITSGFPLEIRITVGDKSQICVIKP